MENFKENKKSFDLWENRFINKDDFECIIDPANLSPIDKNKFSCPAALADAGSCPGLA
jgi:hypothetical protein